MAQTVDRAALRRGDRHRRLDARLSATAMGVTIAALALIIALAHWSAVIQLAMAAVAARDRCDENIRPGKAQQE
jgi:hypothetical protein